jgi:hypothetical protein
LRELTWRGDEVDENVAHGVEHPVNASGLRLGLLPHGTVYLVCPEHDAATRRRDLQGIKGLGFNTVVLWPPASRWDAEEPGGLAFDSIDHAMDICAELGLRAIIELQGQDDNHGPIPEYLPFAHEWPNINHPLIRAATCDFMRDVARHFKGHPALLGYCTFNEVHYTEADAWSLALFASFLEQQYAGDIRALNRAWATFHRRFDEIPKHGSNFRRRIWSSGLMQRDWFRFQQHNFAERLSEWSAVIRQEDQQVVIFADILGCDTMHNRCQFGSNDWLTAAAGDIHGLSCYANMLGDDWRERDAYSWAQFWRQQISAGRGKQTIISELMTHNRSMFPAEGSSMTDQLGLWSHQALFNGIQGVIYWKYRPFIRGLQVAGRGLTDHAGNPTALAHQAKRAAAFSARHADLLARSCPDHAGAAILHDHDAQDLYTSIQAWDPAFYVEAQRGIFRGFWEHGISPRYITPPELATGVPHEIRVLAIPCNVCLAPALGAVLLDFVRRGGVLFTEGRFALLDADGRVYPSVPGAGLREALGVAEVHFTCDARDTVRFDGAAGAAFSIADYLQVLELAGSARALIWSEQGRAVLVESVLGLGRYVHSAALLGRAIHRGAPGALRLFLAAFNRLRPALAPVVAVRSKASMVDVSVLVGDDGRATLVGVCNYRNELSRVEFAGEQLPQAIECSPAKAERTEGGWAIEVPAREVVALIM